MQKIPYIRKLFPDKTTAIHVFLLLILVAAMLMYPITGHCQQEEPDEFGVFPYAGPEGILLVIQGMILHPDNADATGGYVGYNLYKREKGTGDFMLMNRRPISRIGSLKEMEMLHGGPIDGFERLIGLSSAEELWDKIVANDSSVFALAMFSRSFRVVMGLLVVDSNVVDGTTYEYQITRVNQYGGESDPPRTMEATFGIPPFDLLGPIDVTAEPGNELVTLRWKPSPDDSMAFTYSVYRTNEPEGGLLRVNYSPIAFVSQQPDEEPVMDFVDSTVRTGRAYYYAVVSTDYAGNESPKDSLLYVFVKDVVAPNTPQNVMALPSDMGITVTWDLLEDDDVSGYNMYRSLDPDSHYVKINETVLPRDAGYYEDRNVSLVDKYYYRVSAVDPTGNESHLSARAVSIYKNANAPIAPQEVTAESRPDGIFIHWAPNPEEDVRGYYVYRADYLDGELAQVSPLLLGDTTWYLDTDPYLSPRGRYFYYVQAINYSDLASNYSEMVIASPETTAGPEPPLSFCGYQDVNFIRLLWTPKDDNLVAGYHVYRAVMQDSLQWERLTARPVDRYTGMFIDSTARIGTKYLYHIRSINEAGLEGSPSHFVDVSRFEPPPEPPRHIRVNRTPDGLRVRWDPNLQNGVSGYRVYRRTDMAEVNLISQSDIAEDITEYYDRDVIQNTRYYYSVSTLDELGREGTRSPEVEMYYEK